MNKLLGEISTIFNTKKLLNEILTHNVNNCIKSAKITDNEKKLALEMQNYNVKNKNDVYLKNIVDLLSRTRITFNVIDILEKEKIPPYIYNIQNFLKNYTNLQIISGCNDAFDKFKREIDAIIKLIRDTDEYIIQINEEQKTAFKVYSGLHYVAINRCMRGSKTTVLEECLGGCVKFEPTEFNPNMNLSKEIGHKSTDCRLYIRAILNFFDNQKCPKSSDDIIVYRYVNEFPLLKEMKIGELFEESGFLSTSLSTTAYKVSMPNMFKIIIPKGTPIAYIQNLSLQQKEKSEYEVLIRPGASLKLIKKDVVEDDKNGNPENVTVYTFECAYCDKNNAYKKTGKKIINLNTMETIFFGTALDKVKKSAFLYNNSSLHKKLINIFEELCKTYPKRISLPNPPSNKSFYVTLVKNELDNEVKKQNYDLLNYSLVDLCNKENFVFVGKEIVLMLYDNAETKLYIPIAHFINLVESEKKDIIMKGQEIATNICNKK